MIKFISSILIIIFLSTPTFAGKASYYGKKFHGKITASGEIFDMNKMTCAHKTLKFGTKVRVKNLRNGKKAICKINDRGPYVRGRIIDVSRAMAEKLGMLKSGIVPVSIKVIR